MKKQNKYCTMEACISISICQVVRRDEDSNYSAHKRWHVVD
jgi:ribosomal protein S17